MNIILWVVVFVIIWFTGILTWVVVKAQDPVDRMMILVTGFLIIYVLFMIALGAAGLKL